MDLSRNPVLTSAVAEAGEIPDVSLEITKARIGRNPHKPETDVPIPARPMVKLKAGKEMKAQKFWGLLIRY